MNSKLKNYRKNPTLWFKDFWPDIYIWDKLEEISNAIVENRRVVVPSGHGIGKTWLMARIALWFLYCHYPAKVITTAPTWNQVEKLLWSEIAMAHSSSVHPLKGRILLTQLKIEEDWFAIGFSTKGTNAEREYGAPKFQGYHSPNMMIILDEGPGVDHAIWLASETLITGDNNKIVAIGNPTSPTGDFFDACKSPLWKKIEVSSFDHPNIKENKSIVPGAVTRDWIEERRSEWGDDSPLWIAKILGQFPAEGTDTLIPLTWAEACVGLPLEPIGSKHLGVDVARYGGDSTVFTIMLGRVVLPQEVYNKKDTNFTTGRTEVLNKEHAFDAIGVDDGSMGGGVVDNLENDGIDVDAVIFGGSAIEDERFENMKAEIFWNLREDVRLTYEAVKAGKLENARISLPDDKELINQLCSIKYSYTRKGKIKIETKDDMKKRGLKSPDKADSLAIANSAGRSSDIGEISIISVSQEDDDD